MAMSAIRSLSGAKRETREALQKALHDGHLSMLALVPGFVLKGPHRCDSPRSGRAGCAGAVGPVFRRRPACARTVPDRWMV